MSGDCKLVIFNRIEGECDGDKCEFENEIWTLRNMFYSAPKQKVFIAQYVCPNGDGLYGTYEKEIIALSKEEAIKKFNNLDFVKDADSRLHLKSMKQKMKI